MALDLSQLYLASRGHGRMYARGPDSNPQNKPADSAYNAEAGTIGINLTVAFVVDDVVSEGSAAVRFLGIRGPAERASVESTPTAGLSPQIIRIHPRRASRNTTPTRKTALSPSLSSQCSAGRQHDSLR